MVVARPREPRRPRARSGGSSRAESRGARQTSPHSFGVSLRFLPSTAASTATLPRSCRRRGPAQAVDVGVGELQRPCELVHVAGDAQRVPVGVTGRARRRCSRRSRARAASPAARLRSRSCAWLHRERDREHGDARSRGGRSRAARGSRRARPRPRAATKSRLRTSRARGRRLQQAARDEQVDEGERVSGDEVVRERQVARTAAAEARTRSRRRARRARRRRPRRRRATTGRALAGQANAAAPATSAPRQGPSTITAAISTARGDAEDPGPIGSRTRAVSGSSSSFRSQRRRAEERQRRQRLAGSRDPAGDAGADAGRDGQVREQR